MLPLADNDYFSAVDVLRADAVVIYALFIRHPSPRRYLADSDGGPQISVPSEGRGNSNSGARGGE